MYLGNSWVSNVWTFFDVVFEVLIPKVFIFNKKSLNSVLVYKKSLIEKVDFMRIADWSYLLWDL